MNQFDYQRSLFASELTANDRLTAIVIGSHYNWKTKEASFPSNKTIAKESGLSIRSVIRAKNNLVSQGYLVSERHYDASNTYIPCVPQSHEGCQDGNLIDNIKDTLKDTLKDNKDSNESFNSFINKDKVIFLDTNTSGISFGSFKQTEGPAAASDLIDWFG
jgi:DNA-binding transcriptional MocR family regulator